jgi:hypothetical protein
MGLLAGTVWWLRDHGRALLVVGGAGLLCAAIGMFATRPYQDPAVDEQATIMRFGSYAGKYGNRPVVIVRRADGTIRQLRVEEGVTRSCRAGGRIHLVRRGAALFVGPRGCLS